MNTISHAENKFKLRLASVDLIQEYIQDISLIEINCFNEIGIWNVNNFISEYYNKFECSYLLFK